MASLPEQRKGTDNELHTLSDTLLRISRLLHEHTHKLEVAVEGTYASEIGDARVRLLSDSLNVSRMADLELGRLSYTLQHIQQELQGKGSSKTSARRVFEREREELTTNITNLPRRTGPQSRERVGGSAKSRRWSAPPPIFWGGYGSLWE